MSEKLRDYQVLDVLCGGTFYKVRHKVTDNIYAWRAFDCSQYGAEQTQNIIRDVKKISKLRTDTLLYYHDTILHAPSKTLYIVLEFNSWINVEDLISRCKETDARVAESFVWYLLYELARVGRLLEELRLKVTRRRISAHAVLLDDAGALKVDCFDPTASDAPDEDLVQDIGDVIHRICFLDSNEHKAKVYDYGEDMYDVVNFLTDERNSHLKCDIVLYHPTVLANLDVTAGSKRLSDVLLSATHTHTNKCDSEKAVELRRSFESTSSTSPGPTYANITLRKTIYEVEDVKPVKESLSPTIEALALELPGFVPRSRLPISNALDSYKSPQKVSERTLSHQWMSRLIALRQREESLNKRERDLLSKEIVNSPLSKALTFIEAEDGACTNGITLPSIIPVCKEDKGQWVSRRRRRSSSVRTRRQRKSCGYEDLDSSLSADPGDGSMIITATKITKDNMPRRNIFPEVCSKKVHFTPANPFMESDESVTLTFYELENVDIDGYQMPRKPDGLGDISKFKYMDVEKVATEKRSAMQQWAHSSPSKLAKTTKTPLGDITNHGSIRKTPSKTSLASKSTNSSTSTKCSITSGSTWSSRSRRAGDNVSDGTRSGVRCSLAPQVPQTEVKQKPKGRKSLLNFKTPFKFMASSKV